MENIRSLGFWDRREGVILRRLILPNTTCKGLELYVVYYLNEESHHKYMTLLNHKFLLLSYIYTHTLAHEVIHTYIKGLYRMLVHL